MNFIFFYDITTNGGGIGSYLLRVGQWLIGQGHSIYIFSCGKHDPGMFSQLVARGIKIVDIDKINSDVIDKILSIGPLETIRVIHFFLHSFSKLEPLRKKSGCSFSNQIFCVSFDEFTKGYLSNQLIQHLIQKILRAPVLELIQSHQIFFMDQLSKDYTASYYHLPCDPTENVIPLPMYVRPFQEPDTEKIQYDFITLGRADFPFKGYIIGTVRDFAHLKKEYPHIRLLVISGGPDIKILEKTIENLDNHIKKDITLMNWIPYDQLGTVLQSGRIIIGHGTVALDAANSSRPVIVSRVSSYDNDSDGLFGISAKELGVISATPTPAIDYMRQSLEMSLEEYRNICFTTWNYLASNYEIQYVMEKMIDFQVKNHSPIPHLYRLSIYLTYSKIRLWLRDKYKKIRTKNGKASL